MIANLPLLAPSPERGARTVARCHDRLARQRKRREVFNRTPNATYLAIERALVCGVCMMYLSGVALVLIRMLGGK
jgi:hypothetical protein